MAGLGRTLAQCKIRGTNLVRFAILINQMNPGIVVASALYSAYNDFGLLPAPVLLVPAQKFIAAGATGGAVK